MGGRGTKSDWKSKLPRSLMRFRVGRTRTAAATSAAIRWKNANLRFGTRARAREDDLGFTVCYPAHLYRRHRHPAEFIERLSYRP